MSKKLILSIVSVVFGLPWIWLFFHDWKLALALVSIMFANNLMLEVKK